MKFNYIDPTNKNISNINLGNLFQDALSDIEYNHEMDIKLFEEKMPKKALKLLEGKNIALIHDYYKGYDINGWSAMFSLAETDGKPYIGFNMNNLYVLLNKYARMFTRGAIIRLVEHELIHEYQWARGDIYPVTGGTMWRGVFHKQPEVNFDSEDEFFSNQLKLDYELEPYLYNVSVASILTRLKYRRNPHFVKAHKRYEEVFGKKFNPTEYTNILYKGA